MSSSDEEPNNQNLKTKKQNSYDYWYDKNKVDKNF